MESLQREYNKTYDEQSECTKMYGPGTDGYDDTSYGEKMAKIDQRQRKLWDEMSKLAATKGGGRTRRCRRGRGRGRKSYKR